ncbi:protein hsr-9-like isoform X3 [Oscarella lobularis]|uniref:protein hsr-9-like isoform X3 n=1 Tax=Oscarella lobularis TaxID=121494 RepID=UPI003313E1C8
MNGQFSVELVENSQPDEPSISTEGAEHPQIPLLRNLSGFNGPKSDEQPKSGHKSVFDLDEDEIELSPILFRRPATPKSRSKSKRAAGGKRDQPVTEKTKNQETKQVGEAMDKNPEISEQGGGSGAAGGGDDESPSKSSSESEKSKSSQSKNSNSSSSSNSFFDSSTAVPSLASSSVRFQRTATDHEDTTSSVEPASSVSSHSGSLGSSSEEEERRRSTSSSFGGTRVTPVRPSLGPIAGRVSDRSSSSTSGEQTRKRINVLKGRTHEEHISGSPQLISALTQDDDSDRDIIPPTPTTYQAAPVPSSPTELKLSSSSPDVLGESEEMIDELDFQKEDQAKNSGNEKKEESSEASFTSSLMSAPGGTQMELESDLSQKRKRKSQRSLIPPSSLEKRHEMELTMRRTSESEPREEDQLQEGELALLLSENRHDQSLASQYEKGEGVMNKEMSRSDEEKRAETTSDTSGEVEVVRETPEEEEEEESSRPEPEKRPQRLMMYLRHVVEEQNEEGNWVEIKVLQETSHEVPYSGPSNQDPLPVQPKKSGRKRKHQNVDVERGPSPKQRKPSEGSNRVFAQWTDGYYYPGQIRVVHANHRVSIDYDDGDTAMVDQDRIIHLNLVPVGSELTLCIRRHFRGKAVVLRHTDEPGYFLKKENGTEERWGRSNVCLTSEQADKLREKHGSSSDGSRSGSSEGGDNGGGGRSDSSKFGKKFKSRETHKRKRGKSREGNASGALPPSTSLFRNILFALTEGEKKDGGEDLRTAEYRPFDKKLIVRQIEAGGGKIVRKITADMGSPSSSKLSLLIASGPCRTLKYMHALALGVPCVSHEFIGDCCTEGRLLDYMDDQYLLPAGFSLEDDGFKAAELRESGPMLNNVTVYVDGGDKFKSFWKTVLPSCGAKVFSRLASVPQCDCVVSEGRPSPNLIRQAKKSGVPIVSKEWAIQCVINGQKVSYNADKRYTYNYKQ